MPNTDKINTHTSDSNISFVSPTASCSCGRVCEGNGSPIRVSLGTYYVVRACDGHSLSCDAPNIPTPPPLSSHLARLSSYIRLDETSSSIELTPPDPAPCVFVDSTLGLPSKISPEERFEKYVRILFTDIAVLQSFLGELGPGLVVCHDWGYLGDRDQASTIAGFIAPNDEVAGLVESSLVKTAIVHRETPTR